MNNFNEDQLADLEKYQNLWDTHWEILSSLFLERFQGMFQERQSIEILRKHFLQFASQLKSEEVEATIQKYEKAAEINEDVIKQNNRTLRQIRDRRDQFNPFSDSSSESAFSSTSSNYEIITRPTFRKHLEETLLTEPLHLAIDSYFQKVVKPTRDKAFDFFLDGYKEVGGANKETLTEKEVQNRFAALWREGQFSNNWEQDCERYFTSLLTSREQRAQARQLFHDYAQKIAVQSSQPPLDTTQIDRDFDDCWQKYQFYPKPEQAIEKHFNNTKRYIAEQKAKGIDSGQRSHSVSSRFLLTRSQPAIDVWPRVDDDSKMAAPMDLVKLQEKVKEFRQTLENDPRLDTADEHFLECIIAMKNAKAEALAKRLKNPEFQLNLRYFDTLVDFIRFLSQSQASLVNVTQPLTLRAVVGRTHLIYADVKRIAGKTSLIVVEPTSEENGTGIRNMIAAIVEQLSNPFHNASVFVTNAQTRLPGCHIFSIDFSSANTPRPPTLEQRHDRQLAAESTQVIPVFIDSTAEVLTPLNYRINSSLVRTTQIVCSQKYMHLHLEDIAYPQEKIDDPSQTFLSHIANNRVRRGNYIFSNTDELLRIEDLDDLSSYITALLKDHEHEIDGPKIAGQFFADQVADVRPDRQRDWYQYLPKMQAVGGNEWYIETDSAFLDIETKEFIITGEPLEILEKKLTIATEIIHAIPQWHLSPSTRCQGMKNAEALIGDKESIENASEEQFVALDKSLAVLFKMAPGWIVDIEELADLVNLASTAESLNLPSAKAFLQMDRQTETIADWQPHIQIELAKSIISKVLYAIKRENPPYASDFHVRVLLSLLKHFSRESKTPDESIAALSKFGGLVDQERFNSHAGKNAFGATVELAINGGKEALEKPLVDSRPGLIKKIFDWVMVLRAQDPHHLTFDVIQKQMNEIEARKNIQVPQPHDVITLEYSGDRRLVANAPHEMTQIHHLQKSAAQLFDLSSDSDTASEVEKSPQLTAIKEPTDSINQQMEESALFDISSEDSKSRPSSSASNTQFAGSANIPLSHQQKAFFKLLQIMTAHDVNASAAELKACIKLDESITHELIEKGLNILRKKSRSSTFNIKLVPTGEHSLTNTDELIRKLQDHEITEKHFILTNVPGIPYILVQRNPQNNQLHVLLSPEYEQLDSFLGDLSKSRQVMLTSMLSSVQIVKVNGMALVTTQSSAEILRRAPSRSRRH